MLIISGERFRCSIRTSHCTLSPPEVVIAEDLCAHSRSRKSSGDKAVRQTERTTGGLHVTHNGVVEINGKRFVTVGALAELLNLRKCTIQLWARERNVPLVRVGNMMIFELKDLTKWLLRQKR